MELKEIIGKNLLELRKSKNITQLELAEKFNYSDKAVSKWERAETMPDIETLYNLASFYGVSLDYLTTSDHSDKAELPQKRKTSNKLIISLLAITLVWFVACVVFVSLKLGLNINYWMVYVWAVPVTCILVIIFNALWGKRIWRFVALTVLNWSFILAIYLQIANPTFWPIFIVGIPVQFAILFWGKLKRLKIFEKKEQKKSLENDNENTQQKEDE